MAKNAVTDYSTTAASNTDVGGVGIAGTNAISNADDAFREIMSHLAETNAGTSPWADTMTIGDAADLTKEFRFEASGITAGQTRVLTVPDSNGTLLTTGNSPTLGSLEGLTLGAGDMLYATAADTLADLAIGTAGQFLVTNAGATAPEWVSRPTLASLEGLSLVAGDILYATAADTLAQLAKGTAAQILQMNAGATAPEWGDALGTQIAALAYGAIGTYVFGYIRNNGVTEDTNYAGSDIEPGGLNGQGTAMADDTASSGVGIHKGGSVLAGTWRAMGRSNLAGSPLTRWTLFLRVS